MVNFLRKLLISYVSLRIGDNKIIISDKMTLIRILKLKLTIKGNGNILDLRTNIRNFELYINGNKNLIIIGKGIKIKRSLEIYVEDNFSKLMIGEGTTFESAHIALTEDNSNILIGKNCMFSFDIDIRNGDSHCIYDTISNVRINQPGDITINDHVWIGANTSILKNVEIGSNCIIGTKSLLANTQIPENSIVAGVPGRVIKQGVNWHRDRKFRT